MFLLQYFFPVALVVLTIMHFYGAHRAYHDDPIVTVYQKDDEGVWKPVNIIDHNQRFWVKLVRRDDGAPIQITNVHFLHSLDTCPVVAWHDGKEWIASESAIGTHTLAVSYRYHADRPERKRRGFTRYVVS